MEEEFKVKWHAPEFEHRERNVSWYWISMIVAAAIIAFAVWQKNFLFGLFIVIAEMLVIVWGNRTPRIIPFLLTDKGVRIEPGKLHLFSEMESFSVDEALHDEEWDTVIFHFHGTFKLPLIIKLPKEKREEVRTHVKKTLKETDYEPSFLDSLEKIIGF